MHASSGSDQPILNLTRNSMASSAASQNRDLMVPDRKIIRNRAAASHCKDQTSSLMMQHLDTTGTSDRRYGSNVR